MRRTREVLLTVLLLAGLASTAQAGTPGLAPWLPSESYPGGKQADPRLDRHVQFWRAALTLEEVFQGTDQQAGVRISFSPADDENRGVRVHVFLNKEQPPSLRDVMAQLSWVVDCPLFSVEEGGQRVYYLMATSIGRGAGGALQAREREKRREVAEVRQALVGRLSELEEALKLPPEEAVRRYQGKDDRALLDLLDPPHRAATQIAAGQILPWLKTLEMEPDEPPIYHGYGRGYSAGLMLPEEPAAWVAAFGMDPNGMEFQNQKVCFGGGASVAGTVEVWHPSLLTPTGDVVAAGQYTADQYTVLDLRPEAALKSEEQIALRRALGEQISASDEKAFLDRRKRELAAVAAEAQVKASGATLTPQAKDSLAELAVALESGKAYPVWCIAEAVAQATGKHVVSDGLLYASAAAAPSGQARALATLQALCSQPARGFMRTPEWEWGDAGRFLRFRTTNRDIWRAARLPEATRNWLDDRSRPFLPKPEDHAKVIDLTLSVDPEEWTRQFCGVDDLQILHGARVLQGDPHDPVEVARRAAWEGLSQYGQVGLSVLRFLGGLDGAQWQLARAGKLRWPEDVTPDQGKLLVQALSEKIMIQPVAGSYTHMRVSLDEADLYQYRTGGTRLIWWQYRGTSERGGGGGSSDSLVGPPPKACHRVTLAAFAMDQSTKREARAFEKQASFLPKVLTVHAGVPD